MRMSEEGRSVRDGVYIALKHIPATLCLLRSEMGSQCSFCCCCFSGEDVTSGSGGPGCQESESCSKVFNLWRGWMTEYKPECRHKKYRLLSIEAVSRRSVSLNKQSIKGNSHPSQNTVCPTGKRD